MSNFFEELKNRNVYKVATAYVIAGWLIIQVVDTVVPNMGWSDSIPPLVIKILLVGFPIALVLTWLYEFTPQGLKRTGTVQQETADNKKAGRRLNHIIIGALAITICFMLVERVFFAGNVSINKQQKASIAVLPFVNLSSEEENAYFADGLTGQILEEIAQLSGLQVTARTSSFKFKDKNEDVRVIGEQLAVNYLLEGTIRYDSRRNRVRITTLLINASNGYHLWSKTYEEDFDEVFAIQQDVGRKVASELRVQLLPEDEKMLSSKLTENTEAYKLYMLSREYSRKRNDSDLEKGINLLQQALELDPNFAEAHAELSFLYPQRFFYGNMSKDLRNEKMNFHLEKALDLAPNKAEVLRAEASYHLRMRIDSSKAISNLRKAIELKPNYADAHYALFQALSWAKQRALGIKSLERAVELDPLDFFATMLAMTYYNNYHDHGRALAILDKIIKNDPSAGAARHKALILAREPYGDLVESFKLIHQTGKNDPYKKGFLNYLATFSVDLDLLPVTEKYYRLSQMKYPDNEAATFRNISFLYHIKNDYVKLKEWIDFWASEKDLDPKIEAYERVELNASLGNYSKAIELLEKTVPKLNKPTLKADNLDYMLARDLVSYVELLRLNKENQKAERLAQELCNFYDSLIKTDSLMPPHAKYENQLDCYYLSNDTIRFLKKLEDRFFMKKDRLDGFSALKVGWYKRFEGHAGYQQLVDRITEETHRMRVKVIEYLKEQGDWDPAWNKELGLE